MVVFPKNAIAAILIVTILISVLGTWAALSSLAGTGTGYRGTPVKEDTSKASGRVALDLRPPPAPAIATGEVALNLIES